MGTRHLIEVISNGKTKVAQYGQWDGYPEGQGFSILDFLKKVDLATFKEKLNNCHFCTNEEIDVYNKKLSSGELTEKPFQMSRDRGAEILNIIMTSNDQIDLLNDHKFGFDSLFCEWAYVIDLDRSNLEVYSGFNKSEMDELERFYNEVPNDNEYTGVKLQKIYKLNDLPTEDDFSNDFNEEDDD